MKFSSWTPNVNVNVSLHYGGSSRLMQTVWWRHWARISLDGRQFLDESSTSTTAQITAIVLTARNSQPRCEQWQWVDLRELRQTRTEIFIIYCDKGPVLSMLSAHQQSNPGWPQTGQCNMLSDLVSNLATVHLPKSAKAWTYQSPLAKTLSEQSSPPPYPIGCKLNPA